MSKMRLIEGGVGALGGGLIGSALGGMGKKPLNPYSPTPEETEKLRRGKRKGSLTAGIFGAIALPLSAKMRIAKLLKQDRGAVKKMRQDFMGGISKRKARFDRLKPDHKRSILKTRRPLMEDLMGRRSGLSKQKGQIAKIQKAREGSFMGGGKNLGRKVTMKQLFGDLNAPYSTVKENLDSIYDRPVREALSKLIT